MIAILGPLSLSSVLVMSQQTCPHFSELDKELIQDFYGSFQEALEEIIACRDALADNGGDKELINRLFRAVHSLKGNCNMMFLPPFVDVTHKLEEIFEEVRKDRFAYDQAYCIFACTALADIDEQLRALIASKEFNADILDKLGKLTTKIRNESDDNERVRLAQRGATAILDRHYNFELVGDRYAVAESSALKQNDAPSLEQVAYDLEFLSDIGSAIEARYPVWRGRIARQLELVKLINKQLIDPVDETQLTAAIFVHDVCMPWLPTDHVLLWDKLSEQEKEIAIRHVDWATGLLRRWSGWSVAVQFIEDHHECFDGSGQPHRRRGDSISTGGALLALADIFFDSVQTRLDLGYKPSLLGAVKDVNAQSGKKLSPAIVEQFNTVIRQHYLTQPRW